MEYLSEIYGAITVRGALIGGGIFLVTFVVNLALVSLILVKIPADYFNESHANSFLKDHSPLVRLLALIGKNLLGLLLVVVGIILSLPGVPGQGVLTILLGIMLLDFPGRRSLERRIVGQPKVLGAVNKLRHRFGKPDLVLD